MREGPQQDADGDERDGGDEADEADGDVLLRDVEGFVGGALALGGQRGSDAADQRADELEQRPDGGDADGACADAADLPAPDGAGGFFGDAFRALHGGHDGHEDGPGDEQAGEHGEADGEADEVAGAEERELQAAADAGGGRADAEEGCGFTREGAGGDEEGEQRPSRSSRR